MKFPYEVTDPTEISLNDFVEVTATHSGSVVKGKIVQITHPRSKPEALSVVLELVGFRRSVSFSLKLNGETNFSVRILSREKPRPPVGTRIKVKDVLSVLPDVNDPNAIPEDALLMVTYNRNLFPLYATIVGYSDGND